MKTTRFFGIAALMLAFGLVIAACGDDDDLRAEVERLLKAHARAGSFLDQLVIGSQTFYPGGAYDLFLSQLGEGGISTPELADPSTTALFISPNPTVSRSVIEYDLKERSKVVLKLMDITGKEQKILLQEFQAPGRHQYQLNTADLKPGVYFYVISTNKGEHVKKLVKR